MYFRHLITEPKPKPEPEPESEPTKLIYVGSEVRIFDASLPSAG